MSRATKTHSYIVEVMRFIGGNIDPTSAAYTNASVKGPSHARKLILT
jgi:hypothetical protein